MFYNFFQLCYSTRVWPLTLLALRQVANILQVNRNHEDSKSILICEFNKTKINNNNNETLKTSRNYIFDKLHYQNHKFNNLFSKHIKKKKRYEIHEIAQVCAGCAHEASCKCIVDIGSGMGHLARILAFQYGLNVTCIEQDCTLLQQARYTSCYDTMSLKLLLIIILLQKMGSRIIDVYKKAHT